MKVKTVNERGTAKWPARLPQAGECLSITTHSAEETIEFGRALAGLLEAPRLIVLEGELGSGKTTLAKGIVSGLGAATESEVTSPSFTLVHEYGKLGDVTHIDLYRVESPQELATIGLGDVLERKAIVLVECGEKLGDYVTGPKLRIRLEYSGENERRITVENLEA